MIVSRFSAMAMCVWQEFHSIVLTMLIDVSEPGRDLSRK